VLVLVEIRILRQRCHEVDIGAKAELGSSARHMSADRARGEPELVGDELQRVAARTVRNDLAFAPREGRRSRRLVPAHHEKSASLVDEALGERPAAGHERRPGFESSALILGFGRSSIAIDRNRRLGEQ